MSLNNITVFSFPATANRQQTADANGSNRGAPPASGLSPSSNGPDDEDGDARVPVHVDQDDGHTRTGEERDHPGETGNSYEHLFLKVGNQRKQLSLGHLATPPLVSPQNDV